jgi:PAS domain S-box-containing protein
MKRKQKSMRDKTAALPSRKKVEAASVLEEGNLDLLDHMPVGLAVFDQDLCLRWCNSTWVEFIDRHTASRPDQVLPGARFFDLAPGVETALTPVLDRVRSGEEVRLEAFHVESGGTSSYWDVVFTPLMEGGEVVGVLDVTTDATQRVLSLQASQQMVQKLQSQDERLDLIVRGANDGIWDWNLETNQVYFSPRWKSILGYKEDEIPNHFESWQNLIHPDDVERALAAIEDHLSKDRELYELEHRLRHKDGSYRWILARGLAVRDAGGKPVRMVGSHTDITERKQAEEALQHQIAFENVVMAISTYFINLEPDEIDAGIDRALRMLGEFTGVDRSCVFMYSGDRITMDCTHEWCAEGIEPAIQRMKTVPLSALGWSNEKLMRQEVLQISRVAELPPEARAERIELMSQGVQSLIAVPMAYQGEAMGFLALDAVREEKIWSEESIKLLKIAGEILVNALEHKRAQAIQAGQRQFLELLATGGTLAETLHTLVRMIEEQWPGMQGLVLLLDEDGQHLHHGASVSLPEEYVRSIEGLEIGPMVGSCGTACYCGERVVVEDIESDPRWDGLRDLAVKYGLGACWSEPVFSSDGRVIATFAMYYRHPRAPTEAELRTIEIAAHLVGVAVEHQQTLAALQTARDELEDHVQQRTSELQDANRMLQQEVNQRISMERALRRSETKYRELVENADSIILQMDPQGRITFFNRFAQQFFGYEEEEIIGRSVLGTIMPLVDSQGQDLSTKLRDILDHPERYYSSENENIRRNGEWVWVAWTNKALYDNKGRLTEILAIGIDRTQQKRAEEALEQQLKEKAVAAERNRLARDLHDAVTQTLFSASLIAEVLPRLWSRNLEEGQRRLDELRELNRGALAEMRTLLLELRPAVLEEAELADLLRQLADSVIGRARLPVQLSLEGDYDLSAEVKVALYRIAQEALNNIAKHAGASQAEIRLSCDGGVVRLQISDDGVGFDLADIPAKSLGLGIMRERANTIGAQLDVESQIGTGTQITVIWGSGSQGG